MKLEETTITTAGVSRCCLVTIGNWDTDREVNEGDECTCIHCKTTFRLVRVIREYIWKPLWQLEKEAAA